MKRTYISLIAIICVMCLLCGCGGAEEVTRSASAETPAVTAAAPDSSAIDTIVDIATTQYFTDEAVSEEDIKTIVSAGVNAPSAMNGQPWHFSVITDAAVLEQINEGMSFGGGKRPDSANMPEGFEMALPEGMEKPEGDFAGFPEGFKAPDGNAMPPEGMEFPADFEGMEKPEGFDSMQMPEGFDPAEGGFAPPAGFGGGPGGGSAQVKAGLTDAPLVIVISCKAGSELDAGLACQNMSAAAQLLGYGSKILSSPTIALNGEKQDEYRELLGIPEDMSAVAVLLVGLEDSSIDDSMDGYTGASERKPETDVVTYVKK